MAGDAGGSPALPEPESDVLPLDESPRYGTFDIIHHLYKILFTVHNTNSLWNLCNFDLNREG